MSNVGKALAAFKHGVEEHDRRNPSHSAYGIGVAFFDLERLGFDGGEELWSGIRIFTDGGTSGNFRVLCDADHEKGLQESREVTDAVGTELVSV